MSEHVSLFTRLLIASAACLILSVPAYAERGPSGYGSHTALQYAADTTQDRNPEDKDARPAGREGDEPDTSEEKKEAAIQAYDPAEGNNPPESWFACSPGVQHQGGDEKDCLPEHPSNKTGNKE